MCLGEIGRVSDANDPEKISVVIGGRIQVASTVLLSAAPRVGDWVLVHSGLALARLTAAEARAALRLRQGTA